MRRMDSLKKGAFLLISSPLFPSIRLHNNFVFHFPEAEPNQIQGSTPQIPPSSRKSCSSTRWVKAMNARVTMRKNTVPKRSTAISYSRLRTRPLGTGSEELNRTLAQQNTALQAAVRTFRIFPEILERIVTLPVKLLFARPFASSANPDTLLQHRSCAGRVHG